MSRPKISLRLKAKYQHPLDLKRVSKGITRSIKSGLVKI